MDAVFNDLIIDNLSAGYGKEAEVLQAINLRLTAGERVAVIGPNASGKSTLLKTICGELCPSQGQIIINGTPLSKVPLKKRARIMTRVLQSPIINGEFSVQEYVAMGRYPHLRFNAAETPRDFTVIKKAMEWAGLTEIGHRRLGTLSGGERQRVALAQALAQETPVLLLDEPNVFLDLHHQQALFSILIRLHLEAGRTILAVLHDINLAAAFAERIIVLDKGGIAADGPPAIVLEDALIEKVYRVRTARIAGPNGTPHFVLLSRESGTIAEEITAQSGFESLPSHRITDGLES